MFGEAWRITSEFPYYFLDYREVMDDQERWNDRFTSDDGTWSGNLYDFGARWSIVCGRLLPIRSSLMPICIGLMTI